MFVSVPFRGSCSEIPYQQGRNGGGQGLFPSPFGVRVLKSLVVQGLTLTLKFPSPFGVRVLKFRDSGVNRRHLVCCFRPLSGFVF